MEIGTSGEVRFIVQIGQHSIFKEPYEVYVVGNIKELGDWSPSEGIKMKWISAERLEASIKIPKNANNIVEYKYVNITTNNRQINWEHGENRKIQNLDSEFLQIQDHYRAETTPFSVIPDALVYLDKLFGRTPEQKISLQVPSSDMVLLRFKVLASTLDPRNQIAVCGSCPQLAEWNRDNSVVMQFTYPHWEVDVYVPRKLFPIEYKYLRLFPTQNIPPDFEVGQNHLIDLPINSKYNECVIQLNDNFRILHTAYYAGITSPISDMGYIINDCESSRLNVTDAVVMENGKFIMGSLMAIYVAQKLGKPISRITNVQSYTIQWEFGVTHVFEALCNPESSVRKLTIDLAYNDGEEISRILKCNRSISTIELTNDDYDEVVEVNAPKILEGLAKNEFPSITTLHTDGIWNSSCIEEQMLEVMKSNRYITSLRFSSDDQTSEEICRALSVNSTLTRLEIFKHDFDLELLAKTINAKKTLKELSLTVHQCSVRPLIGSISFLRKLHLQSCPVPMETFKDMVEAMKKSKTITNFALAAKSFLHHLHDIVDPLFEVNYNLTNFAVWSWQNSNITVTKECERNRKYQRQLHENIIVIMYNIVRSQIVLDLLPKEVWLVIFSFIDSAFGYDYREMMNDLFKNGTIRKL